MFAMDIPTSPPSASLIVFAQASPTKSSDVDRTIGICHPIENKPESKFSALNSIGPVASAYSYLKKIEHRVISEADFRGASMALLERPTHGDLVLYDKVQAGSYSARSPAYFGPDHATVLVRIGHYKVTLQYFFNLMESVPGSTDEGEATDIKAICPKGAMWKISGGHKLFDRPLSTRQIARQ